MWNLNLYTTINNFVRIFHEKGNNSNLKFFDLWVGGTPFFRTSTVKEIKVRGIYYDYWSKLTRTFYVYSYVPYY